MSDNDTLITLSQLPLSEMVKLVVIIVIIICGIIGIIAGVIFKIIPSLKKMLSQRSLLSEFNGNLNKKILIKNSLKYYLYPQCQSSDPAGGDESRLAMSKKTDLFRKIDAMLKNPLESKYVILLADSGMGKTSFLLNYYTKNLLNKSQKYTIEPINLGTGNIDRKISKIENKEKTVLFLDALDEDTLAIVDHVKRIHGLIELTKDFYKIVITCQTQFFPSDEEILKEAGLQKAGLRNTEESRRFTFHKIYLSPFSEEQIEKYIKRRYNIFKGKKRRKAFKTVRKIPDLFKRPMVLSYIDWLIDQDINIKYTFQLFEEIVTAWLTWEAHSFKEIKIETLRKFLSKLAIDVHVNKLERNCEKISVSEIKKMAKEWGINIDLWHLTSRSLLNRDTRGNFKFSHRLILEYLVAHSILKGEHSHDSELQITDQIEMFLREMIVYRLNKNEPVLPDIIGKVLKRPILIKYEHFDCNMVLIPPGEFLFGEKIQQVNKSIEKPFALCIYPVTQYFYKKITGKNPSHFRGDDLPVELVSWFDAIEFCNRLSEQMGLRKVYTVNGREVITNMDANGYRLPTEVEWEYACRAGIEDERYGELDEIGWYCNNSGGKTHPVGQKKQNDFGLYDMLGNVLEWCGDWHIEGVDRVIRGGSWVSNAGNCRSASRSGDDPEARFDFIGFRLARGHIEK